MKWIRARPWRGGREVGAPLVGDARARGTRAGSGARRAGRPRARARAARSRAPRRGRRRAARSPAARCPRGRCRSRRSRAARPARAAATSGQAATSRSTPFETISLPTKLTMRSRSGSSARSASAAPASPPQPAASAPSSRSASARSRSAAASVARARTRRRRRPAGPSRVLLGQRRVVHHLPQPLGRVARADQHGARARQALGGVGQEALAVRRDRVGQRAAVDLHRVGRVEPARQDHRAHDQVVGQADLDAARARRPRARRPRWPRRSARPLVAQVRDTGCASKPSYSSAT